MEPREPSLMTLPARPCRRTPMLRRTGTALIAAGFAASVCWLATDREPARGPKAGSSPTSATGEHLPPVSPAARPSSLVDRDRRSRRASSTHAVLPVRCVLGVDCSGWRACGQTGWDARRAIPWEFFAQGEYAGTCAGRGRAGCIGCGG